MEMTSLRLLHKSMLAVGTDIQQFRINTGSASVDCLFSTRENPFSLALTSRGSNPKFFKFDVQVGYRIVPYFGDFYSDLVEVLRSGANTGQKLIPKDFLEQLNNQIPIKATSSNTPSTSEIIRLRQDITEDRERPHFDTWIFWKSKDRQGPTKENQHKTLVVMGPEALQFSLDNRASSKWSAKDLGRDWREIKKKPDTPS